MWDRSIRVLVVSALVISATIVGAVGIDPPSTVVAASPERTVSADGRSTCALVDGGTEGGVVECWGSNERGQLGVGSRTGSVDPVRVPGLVGVVALSTSSSRSDFDPDRACAVTGTGEVIRVDGECDPDLLRVAKVSLGALGVITEATLQLVPAFRLHAVETVEVLDEVLGDVDAFASSADHAELFWMPGARRCQVKRNRRTDEPARPQPTLAYVRDKWIGENIGFGLVCRAGRRFPSIAPRIAKLVAASEIGRASCRERV
mgnify:CR=1 FL=1